MKKIGILIVTIAIISLFLNIVTDSDNIRDSILMFLYQLAIGAALMYYANKRQKRTEGNGIPYKTLSWKKLITILFAFTSVMLLCGKLYYNSGTEIEKAIKGLNSQCPIEVIDDICEIRSIHASNQTIYCVLYCDEAYFDIDYMKTSKFKSDFIDEAFQNIPRRSNEMKVLNLIYHNGYTLKYVIKTMSGKKVTEITVSNQLIGLILNSKKSLKKSFKV